MTPRVASSLMVGGFIRKAEAEGGFAAVLKRGDADSGSIVIILTERGANPWILERILHADGGYKWRWSSEAIENTEEISGIVARRASSDPDLWILELDVPSKERFAAEMTAFG